MSPQPSQAIPSLGDTFGALFVVAIISTILFGITNLQTLIYYKKYPNDSALYRYSVALLWALDALHVALGTHALYYYLIDMYGNFLGALIANVWTMKLQLVLKVWMIVLVQGLYAIRLWKLGRHFHKTLPWFVFVAVAASFGAGIYNGPISLSRCNFTDRTASVGSYDIYITPNLVSISVINTSVYTFYSIIITADFIIAVMMCYYLHKSRAAMHFSSKASLLLGLMQFVLVSGLATSICSLFSILTYVVWPKTLIFVAIDFILPKLYINSLLAMFNYRDQRSWNRSTNEDTRHSITAILQFAPNNSEGLTTETDRSPPLSEIKDIDTSDKSGISKETVDSEV